ncbi:MAG: cob(I)yrinic acid a,c-diamide adenosyltransferase [Proteobacteria bacterium]|nr:MAG: cob(I)yrinic acid a,c-diamide adenosyltransferase [Pseudomonadota bacterium]
MGHRLSKIYTRTGDDGTTGLGRGDRVAKDSARIEAIGAVDETNCHVGIVLCHALPDPVTEVLTRVQHELFDLGGELALPEFVAIDAESIRQLESDLDKLNAELPPLKEFILPGGTSSGAACHLARAVCRRAERRLVTLAQQERVSDNLPRYLNRLSDLLFVTARVLVRSEGSDEVLWQSRQKRDNN